MVIYHEISKENAPTILREGLKRGSRGKKGQEPSVIATDHFLDERIPAHLKRAGVCRNNCLYGFVGDEDTITDITNGSVQPLANYQPSRGCMLLKLHIDQSRCFISDLDLFDAVKDALKHKKTKQAAQYATRYWHKVTPLKRFETGTIARPEVLIACDIPPTDISTIK